MDYVPHTWKETLEMLHFLGLEQPVELFQTIPSTLQNPDIDFPPPLTEGEISQRMQAAARENRSNDMAVFLGGGAYSHFIPQAVSALISRGDFLTAYTPYQAEAGQGTLQAIYEFQTLLCRLTGMETANASLYDGATALAEAALMSCRITRKEKVCLSSTINPHYRRVVRAYLEGPGIQVIEIPHQDGVTHLERLAEQLDADAAAVFIQNPNYFGILEPADEVVECARKVKAIPGMVVYPHSLGLLKPPGAWGAELVVGDLQSFGLPLNYGGPYAGFIATRQQYVRHIPGRLAGRTRDRDGRVGYVLTLQTREQQIRREKATSNICTNQALCALAVTIYLSLLGKKGLRRAAELSVRKAHELQQVLCSIRRVNLIYQQPFFNEFVLELPIPVDLWLKRAREEGILAGIRLAPGEAADKETLLVCATETTTKENMDRYCNLLARMLYDK